MFHITEDNLKSFLDYYHVLHDSNITNVNYDIEKSQIELIINVFWSNEPKIQDDNTIETNKTKLRMIFNGVEEYKSKELFSWDYITNAYIKFIMVNNKKFICLADDEIEPQIYIVCDSIEYEEIK